MLLTKNIFGQISILDTKIDYAGKDGYAYVDTLPDAPQELWDIKEGKLIVKEPPVIPLDELKVKKKAEINAHKEKEEYANITYLDTQFQADADSQFKILSSINVAIIKGLQEYTWWDADNNKVTLTTAQLITLGEMIAERSAALVEKGRTLKDAIDKAATKTALENITWEQ